MPAPGEFIQKKLLALILVPLMLIPIQAQGIRVPTDVTPDTPIYHAIASLGLHEGALQGAIAFYPELRSEEAKGELVMVEKVYLPVDEIAAIMKDGRTVQAEITEYRDDRLGWEFVVPTSEMPEAVRATARVGGIPTILMAEGGQLSRLRPNLPDHSALELENPEAGECTILDNSQWLIKSWRAVDDSGGCHGHDAVTFSCNGHPGDEGYAEVTTRCGRADAYGGYSSAVVPEGNAAGANWYDRDIVPYPSSGVNAPIPVKARVTFYIEEIRQTRGYVYVEWAFHTAWTGYHFERREVYTCDNYVLTSCWGERVTRSQEWNTYLAPEDYVEVIPQVSGFSGSFQLCGRTAVDDADCATGPGGVKWTVQAREVRMEYNRGATTLPSPIPEEGA